MEARKELFSHGECKLGFEIVPEKSLNYRRSFILKYSGKSKGNMRYKTVP